MKIKSIVILSLIFIGMFSFYHFNNKSIDKELKQFGVESVARVYDLKFGAKNVSLKFKYKFDKKMYLSGKPADKIANRKSLIGKYFLIIVSSKNPETARIDLSKEVKDETIIAELGF